MQTYIQKKELNSTVIKINNIYNTLHLLISDIASSYIIFFIVLLSSQQGVWQMLIVERSWVADTKESEVLLWAAMSLAFLMKFM